MMHLLQLYDCNLLKKIQLIGNAENEKRQGLNPAFSESKHHGVFTSHFCFTFLFSNVQSGSEKRFLFR